MSQRVSPFACTTDVYGFPARVASPVTRQVARAVTPAAYAGYTYTATAPAPVVAVSSGAVPPQAYSQVEESIVKSVNPLPLPAAEVISAGGHTGALVNKHEDLAWRGSVPIQSYAINHDPCPTVIRKKPAETVLYNQEVAVKYLKPPQPAPHGDLVIRREPNIPTEPAPPVVIRQQPPPPQTPPPVIVREAPPPPPPVIPQQLISIPGQRIPPAPRKVVVEKLPQLPNKPQNVFIERWLPYEARDRRVVYQPPPPDPVVTKPKNVIVEWESPNVQVRRDFKDLGVYCANPEEYVRIHGGSLVPSGALPQFVREVAPPTGVVLAADYRAPVVNRLVGDLHALSLVDLERQGLGEYRSYCTSVVSAPVVAATPLPAYYDSWTRPLSPAVRPLSRCSFTLQNPVC